MSTELQPQRKLRHGHTNTSEQTCMQDVCVRMHLECLHREIGGTPPRGGRGRRLCRKSTRYSSHPDPRLYLQKKEKKGKENIRYLLWPLDNNCEKKERKKLAR